MKKILHSTLLSLVLLLAGLSAAVQAAPPEHRGGGRGASAQEHGGERAAAARAQRQYGGRILSVRTVEGRGGIHYRVKLLSPDGRVRVVRVPAG